MTYCDEVEAFDVVIVGAGMVGLMAANLLATTLPDVTVAIIEARPVRTRTEARGDASDVDVGRAASVADFQPRVSAITLASEQLFRSVGVWASLQPHATPFSSMQIREQDGTGEVRFDAFDAGEAYAGYIIENRHIEQSLLDRLREMNAQDKEDRLQWFSPDRLLFLSQEEDETWRLSLSSGQHIRTNVIVGADGAQSPTRAQLGFDTVEWDYHSTSIVATIETQKPHGGVARQVFTSSGPLAFLPLGGPDASAHRFVSIVWSVKPGVAEHLMSATDDEFIRALEHTSEQWLGSVVAVSQRFSFPLKQRHATRYTQPGAVLVGDAAHAIHPLAGQGVNLGFLDVAVLVEEWQALMGSRLSLGDARILRRYERRRKAGNIVMTSAVELFKRIYEADAVSIRLARNRGMHCVNRLEPLKHQIMAYAMGRIEDLPQSAIKEPMI